MAEKRMLSQKITESDAFLDMALSAQALYMHIVMMADDDGFVNSAKRIQRMCGASPEDLRELIERRFLFEFESGVMAVKHWGVCNKVRDDRKKPTSYKEELSTLYIKEDGSYTRTPPAAECQQNDGGLTAERQQNDSLGEVRLGKDNIYTRRKKKSNYNDFPQRHYSDEEINDIIRRKI